MTSAAVSPALIALLREPDLEAQRAAREAMDWEEVIRAAASNGLRPWVYRWLARSGLEPQLPREAADRLRRDFYGVAARNLLLSVELAHILRLLEEARVRCAPLRGLALAERLYGEITARPMGDLDLLVRKEDLSAVSAILGKLGFREMDRRPGFSRAFSYTLKFCKARHGWVIVEPHWTITYPPFVDRVDMERVWQRCARGRVAGVDTWVLGGEALLLHLGLHIAHRDGAAPLLWTYELDRLVRQERETFDWSEFLALALRANVGVLISGVLRQVRALFSTPIQDEVFDRLAVAPLRSAESRWLRLLGDGSRVDGKESLLVLFTLKGLRAKLRYALALLFPSAEFMVLQYGLARKSGLAHSGQLGVTYVRRVCRFSWESVKGVAKLVQRTPPGVC